MPGVSTTIVAASPGTGGARTGRPRVGGQGREQPVQLVGVLVDGQDALALEQVGEGALGDQAVLEQVADARRDPQVVLQHEERAVGAPHEVGPADVRPHAPLRRGAPALGPVVGGVLQQLRREHAVAHDLLVVVQVVDEPVQRPQPLRQPDLDGAPLGRVDHPGDHVERPRAVDAAAVGVDGEGDPERQDLQVGEVLAGLELGGAEVADHVDDRGGRLARLAVGRDQLVPGVGEGSQFGHGGVESSTGP